jgi:hypothetical protein
VARLPSALPSEIGHEFDMRFTSEAARFGSLVPPATSPLTTSMPSTSRCFEYLAVSVANVANVRLCATENGPIGKQIGKQPSFG